MQKIKSHDSVLINYDKHQNEIDHWLVFIHGVGGSLNAWDKERNFFHKKGYSTLAIDLRGHGSSERPNKFEEYTLNNFVKDINKIITYEKISKFTLIGHCFGGMLSIIFHHLFPNKASSYVLIDTTYKSPMINEKLKSSNIMKWAHKILNGINGAPGVANFKQFEGTGDYNMRRIYSDITNTTLKSWVFTLENIGSYDGIEILKKITQPVLIIHGEKDKIFPIDKAYKIDSLVKNSILSIIPNTNHIIVINNPAAINKSILRFISTNN